jgi:hypothetical protein
LKVTACKWPQKIKAKNLIDRKKALNEWILGNANLWAGHRSLIVGHLAKPFFVADQRKEKKYATNRLQPVKRQAGNN